MNRVDQALHFAEMNQRTNEFCKKVWRHFDLLGYISNAQVEAVLRIKQEKEMRHRKACYTPPVV